MVLTSHQETSGPTEISQSPFSFPAKGTDNSEAEKRQLAHMSRIHVRWCLINGYSVCFVWFLLFGCVGGAVQNSCSTFVIPSTIWHLLFMLSLSVCACLCVCACPRWGEGLIPYSFAWSQLIDTTIFCYLFLWNFIESRHLN